MKIILSRKGFDSQYGGMASPILPDGRLVPLPIPSKHDHHTFAALDSGNLDLDQILSDLSKGKHELKSHVHLDPDLNRARANRLPNWRPAFGQTGSAQGHLAANLIGAGDVFLFFGWFRQVDRINGRWAYIKNSPDLHVLFGWLEVDEVMHIVESREQSLLRHPWMADHPHFANPEHYTDRRNSLYVATTSSRYSDRAEFGAGQFNRLTSSRQLTAAGSSRSKWRLPAWFLPTGRPPLTYHSAESRWRAETNSVMLQTVAKGQEFILDAAHYPEAHGWIKSIIREHE